MWLIAALAVALEMSVAAGGYHRDELYFLEASKHMAWGYVDQPPLSVAMVWASRHVFGEGSAIGLRVFPALAEGAITLLAGLAASELGAKRFGQILAALSVAVSPILIAGHLAGPTVYDIVAWSAVSLLVIRILRTKNERLWLAVGVVTGIALLNKETILLLIGGLTVGFLVTGSARLFRSSWLWAGAAIATIIWSPTLVWEASHSWPTLQMDQALRQEHSGLSYLPSFVPIQILLPGWWVAPVWISGLLALWREARFRRYRAFSVAYAVVFAGLFVFIPDRPYYVAGLYPILLGAGAVVAEDVVAGTRRFLSERVPGRRLIWRSPRAAVVWVSVVGIIGLPLSLPILPPQALARVPLQNLNYNLGEVVGWPQLVRTIAQVYRSMPPAERATAAVFAANYGEAGAVDRYGAAYGLPTAYSGHNNFWWWGPPPEPRGTTIAIGFDRSYLLERWGDVTLAARIDNGYGVANDEQGQPVWLCRNQRASWASMWPSLRHYG